MTEASDYKFGMPLWFAKAHHKIAPIRKSGPSSGLRENPKIWGSLLKCLMTEASDFKFGSCLGLPRPVIKSQTDTKVGVALVWGAPKNWGSL